MHDDNVLKFPLRHSEPAMQYGDSFEPQQLDLFSGSLGAPRAIVYLSLNGLDQNMLLHSLIKNSVQTIIDLRGRPVFPKPRFDHKYLMTYFYNRSMEYIELAMVKHYAVGGLSSAGTDRLSLWISRSHNPGVTVCIADDESVDGGAVTSFRHRIAASAFHWVELHPRAIF